MQRVLVFACLFASVSCTLLNYYSYFSKPRSWDEAQTHCRTHYTDLAFIQSEFDHTNFLKVAEKYGPGWIGLMRNASSADGWSWSGGWHFSFNSWAPGEPNNGDETRASVDQTGLWYDTAPAQSLPCYCVAAYQLQQTARNWEQALQHCNSNGSELYSTRGPFGRGVATWLMKQRGLERVWVGLRFLGGQWLWLNGGGPNVEDWEQGADHCPLRSRCGALNLDGKLESRDCTETLGFVCR